MRHLFKLFGTIFFLSCLGLVILWGLTVWRSNLLQREARRGLDQVVSNELPILEGFDTIEVVSLESSHTVYGDTCYYAGDYLILGGSLTEIEALDKYVDKLESSGWIPREKQYPTSKVFMYGDHVQLVARTGDLAPNLRDYVDYIRLREKYSSIIFVRINYMLPNREDC